MRALRAPLPASPHPASLSSTGSTGSTGSAGLRGGSGCRGMLRGMAAAEPAPPSGSRAGRPAYWLPLAIFRCCRRCLGSNHACRMECQNSAPSCDLGDSRGMAVGHDERPCLPLALPSGRAAVGDPYNSGGFWPVRERVLLEDAAHQLIAFTAPLPVDGVLRHPRRLLLPMDLHVSVALQCPLALVWG